MKFLWPLVSQGFSYEINDKDKESPFQAYIKMSFTELRNWGIYYLLSTNFEIVS